MLWTAMRSEISISLTSLLYIANRRESILAKQMPNPNRNGTIYEHLTTQPQTTKKQIHPNCLRYNTIHRPEKKTTHTLCKIPHRPVVHVETARRTHNEL